MRILHVVGGLNRGGAETWLVQVLRNIDREKYQIDFLVHTTEPCAYDEEVRGLGSRIIPCLSPAHPLQYARNFRKILETYGPYDCVHSHVHHYSGYVMLLAAIAGVPIRVVQSHTAHVESKPRVGRKMYLRISKALIQNFATKGIAVSELAGDSIFPKGWKRDKQWSILSLGIDLTPFQQKVDGKKLRANLGIPEDAWVVGHVGRFVEAKNHCFLVQVAQSLSAIDPRAFFLLVGDGPLRSEIEESVRESGLSDRFLFAGVRGDVPALMKGAMDAFLFPSRYEGLPLALLEAQAAGLRCVVADTVSSEGNTDLITQESLTVPPAIWAQTLRSLTRSVDETGQVGSNTIPGRRTIVASTSELCALYSI